MGNVSDLLLQSARLEWGSLIYRTFVGVDDVTSTAGWWDEQNVVLN